ncbi:hypothetical protein V8E36_008155 [Tilletia maclaganii]
MPDLPSLSCNPTTVTLPLRSDKLDARIPRRPSLAAIQKSQRDEGTCPSSAYSTLSAAPTSYVSLSSRLKPIPATRQRTHARHRDRRSCPSAPRRVTKPAWLHVQCAWPDWSLRLRRTMDWGTTTTTASHSISATSPAAQHPTPPAIVLPAPLCSGPPLLFPPHPLARLLRHGPRLPRRNAGLPPSRTCPPRPPHSTRRPPTRT